MVLHKQQQINIYVKSVTQPDVHRYVCTDRSFMMRKEVTYRDKESD